MSLGLVLFSLVLSAKSQSTDATSYYFTGLAGDSSIGSTDGMGQLARFRNPQGLAIDATGNLYVADSGNYTIRKISPGGLVTTLAGKAGQPGSADGVGGLARFAFPSDVVVDTTGTLYVADGFTIRKVTPTGVVTTFAGAAGISGSTDGMGRNARFNAGAGLALDSVGNLFVADGGNHLIRKITSAGVVTTIAGTVGVSGRTDGAVSTALFSYPFRIAVDAAGALYVSEDGDFAYDIRKISPDGMVTTIFAGDWRRASVTLNLMYYHDRIGLGSLSGSSIAMKIAVDSSGKVYFTDPSACTINEISQSGVVTPLAGSSDELYGSTDGNRGSARFYIPIGLAADPSGNLYVADAGNNTIRKITSTGVVSTLAGLPPDRSYGSIDGAGQAARFSDTLGGIVAAPSGDVYVTDAGNHTIRKITPAGLVSTLAGLAGASGNDDGIGAVARFGELFDIAVDSTGKLYCQDFYSGYLFREITAEGRVTTLAGLTEAVSNSLAIDAAGNHYVPRGFSIEKISPAGVVTVLAGQRVSPGTDDGTGSLARFGGGMSLTIDHAGNVYVAESVTHTIRRVTPAGAVSTLTGLGNVEGRVDGTGSNARLNSPRGIAVDDTGNVYVADTLNQTIRKVTPSGVVTTVAGLAGGEGVVDGTGQEARFILPEKIAVDASGTLYVTSLGAVRKGVPAGPPVIATQPLSQAVASGASVQFSVKAGAVPAPTYQWFFNGSAFSGATTNTLSFASARSADVGDYTVVVTNSLGAVTSAKATLTISAAPVTPTPPSTPTPAPAGGGSIDGWLVLALVMLGMSRGWKKHMSGR